MSTTLENSIAEALIIKSKLEKSFESLFPSSKKNVSVQVFASLKSALEDCLSLTPSVREHQEEFLKSVFPSTENAIGDLALPKATLPCKEYIQIEDNLLRISDLYLLIDFENKEKEINKCLSKVKGNVVLPILRADSNLEAHLKD